MLRWRKEVLLAALISDKNFLPSIPEPISLRFNVKIAQEKESGS
jgi:hypothetical protein